jgi:hypothetical protein
MQLYSLASMLFSELQDRLHPESPVQLFAIPSSGSRCGAFLLKGLAPLLGRISQLVCSSAASVSAGILSHCSAFELLMGCHRLGTVKVAGHAESAWFRDSLSAATFQSSLVLLGRPILDGWFGRWCNLLQYLR